MADDLNSFWAHRERMNRKILDAENLDIKRFFALDSSVYRAGVLDVKTKELLGLTASAVLRCNDCILYHLIRCAEEGVTDAEIHEALSIALIVGGSITIPHLRYAFGMLEEIRSEETKRGSEG